MSYEVQSHKNGKWIIEAILDDEEEAIFDAQRLSKTRDSVRVVEETFLPETETFRTKVVYRREREISSIEDEEKKRAEEEPPEHAPMEPELGLYEQLWLDVAKFFRRLGVSVRRFMDSTTFIILKFFLIAGFGLWLLYILQKMAAKL